MSAKTFAELISDDLFNQTMIFFLQIIYWKFNDFKSGVKTLQSLILNYKKIN